MKKIYTEKEARALVKEDGLCLENLSKNYKNDRDLVLTAVKQNGRALIYANVELRNDKEVVLAAVSQLGLSIEYASDQLKDDKEVVLAVVTQNGNNLRYASTKLQNDMEVILTAVYVNSGALMYCKKCTKVHDKAVTFVRGHRAFITDVAWPLVKKALVEKPDYFLNPEPYMKALAEGIENPYLMLAQYALNKDVVIEPKNYPDIEFQS